MSSLTTNLNLRIAHTELLLRHDVLLNEIVGRSRMLQARVPAGLLGVRGDVLDMRRRLHVFTALCVHLFGVARLSLMVGHSEVVEVFSTVVCSLFDALRALILRSVVSAPLRSLTTVCI